MKIRNLTSRNLKETLTNWETGRYGGEGEVDLKVKLILILKEMVLKTDTLPTGNSCSIALNMNSS